MQVEWDWPAAHYPGSVTEGEAKKLKEQELRTQG